MIVQTKLQKLVDERIKAKMNESSVIFLEILFVVFQHCMLKRCIILFIKNERNYATFYNIVYILGGDNEQHVIRIKLNVNRFVNFC